MGILLAACVVHRLHDDAGSVGTTAIDKRPVEGPVRVRTLGLHGDVQASRAHHGGEGKAVYAYAQEDASFWQHELQRALPAGWFGENLRVDGMDVSGARAGERWTIGGVVLEVTMPRTPCETFARWVGGEDARGWVKRFSDAGRPGAYLRVVQSGMITAGDAVEVVAGADASAPTVVDMLIGNRGRDRVR